MKRNDIDDLFGENIYKPKMAPTTHDSITAAERFILEQQRLEEMTEEDVPEVKVPTEEKIDDVEVPKVDNKDVEETLEEVIEDIEEEPAIEEEIVDETEDEPEIGEETTPTEVEEDIQEKEEDTKIIKTEDGEITIYSELEAEDTDEPKAYNTVEGVVNYGNIAPFADNGLIFGDSKFKVATKKIDPGFVNPLDLLKEFKTNGVYIDVYLPVSNIGVRVYEFDDVVYYESVFNAIRTYAAEYLNRVMDEKIPVTRRLLSLIKENCVFLCADGNSQNNMDSFDKLSATDIELLLLGVAAMVTFVHNKKKNYLLNLDSHLCTSCKSILEKTEVDLIKLFKSQYTKLVEFIPDIQQRIDKYDMNETFAEKLNKSIHNKMKIFKISRKTNGVSYDTLVAVKDPSYGANKLLLDSLCDHVVKTYVNKLAVIVDNIPNFNSLSNQAKIVAIIQEIQKRNIDNDNVQDFIQDYVSIILIPYISYIRFDKIYDGNTPNESYKTVFEDLSFEYRFKTLAGLSVKLRNSIHEFIQKLNSSAIKEITAEIVCKKCAHKNELAIDPVMFFFMTAEIMHRERTVQD